MVPNMNKFLPMIPVIPIGITEVWIPIQVFGIGITEIQIMIPFLPLISSIGIYITEVQKVITVLVSLRPSYWHLNAYVMIP